MASEMTIDPQDVGSADLATVASVMNASPRTCSPFSSVTEASLIFRDCDCGIVPVIDEGKPVGVVTDRDVALSLSSYPDLATKPVSEIMTKDVVTVRPETTLLDAAKLMAERQVRRLLVVDEEGALAGVVAWADLTPAITDGLAGSMVTEVVEPA